MKNFLQAEFDEVWENLRFFVSSLKRIKNSRFFDLNEKCFCVDTGCESASENWVYYPQKINYDDVSKIINFFGKRDFVFPIYEPIEPIKNSEIEFLKQSGLNYAGNLLAMNFVHSKITSDFNSDFVIADNKALLNEWAEVSLRGFEVDFEKLPEQFLNLALSFENNEQIIPVIAKEKITHKNLGSFLIANSQIKTNLSGIYYFSVIPEFRRKGIARDMMNFAANFSHKFSNKIILQATPSGIPFYRNFGFKELFEIKLFSCSNDVF